MDLVFILIGFFIFVCLLSRKQAPPNVVIKHLDAYDIAQLEVQRSIDRYLSMPKLILKRHWCDPKYFDLWNRKCLACGKTDLEIAMTEPHANEEQIEVRQRFMNTYGDLHV
jgi:hypothetical protein